MTPCRDLSDLGDVWDKTDKLRQGKEGCQLCSYRQPEAVSLQKFARTAPSLVQGPC
jgi:hypothetical protein